MVKPVATAGGTPVKTQPINLSSMQLNVKPLVNMIESLLYTGWIITKVKSVTNKMILKGLNENKTFALEFLKDYIEMKNSYQS